MLRICAVCLLLPAVAAADGPKEAVKSRTVLFTYAGAITGVEAGKSVSGWLPMPPSNEEQQVEIVSKKLPAEARLNKEPWYDNQMFYFDAKAGPDGRPQIATSLTIQNGEMFLGPAKLGKAPRIDW